MYPARLLFSSYGERMVGSVLCSNPRSISVKDTICSKRAQKTPSAITAGQSRPDDLPNTLSASSFQLLRRCSWVLTTCVQSACGQQPTLRHE